MWLYLIPIGFLIFFIILNFSARTISKGEVDEVIPETFIFVLVLLVLAFVFIVHQLYFMADAGDQILEDLKNRN